ncbi:MAG: ABC transporter permease [Rikenellaceae bacterium]
MLRFLIEKEFKLIRRNSFLPRMIVLMPMTMMLVLPFAANMEVKDIRLAVVDSDKSTLSSNLVEKVVSSDYFHLTEYADSYEDAIQKVENGKADIILSIPRFFGQNLASGEAMANVFVASNSVNAIRGSMSSSYLVSIIENFAASTSPQHPKPEINVSVQNRFNSFMDYKIFMVPALMVMLLTIMCGFLPALNIVSEKESGTIEQMNVTPVGKTSFILAKLIPYWIIGYIALTICFFVAFVVYGLVAVGSYTTIYLSTMLFILTVSGIGLLISNFSSTLQQAMFVMFFFSIIMILMSGLFTPIQSMPMWAQDVTLYNPLRYFIRIMRGVYLKGSTLSDIWRELLALGAFAITLNSIAVVSYRKRG